MNCCYIREWYCQPFVGYKPAGNLLMSAGILFLGSIPSKTLRMYREMNIQCISISTYMQHQKYYLHPANFQNDYVDYATEKNLSLNLGGDGRADTPGHSAKYNAWCRCRSCYWYTACAGTWFFIIQQVFYANKQQKNSLATKSFQWQIFKKKIKNYFQ